MTDTEQPSDEELQKLKAQVDQQTAKEYAQMDTARQTAIVRLKRAIDGEINDTPSSLLYELIQRDAVIPLPDNIPWYMKSMIKITAKKAVEQLVHAFPQAFVLLATPEGKKWIRENLDDFLDYISTLSMSDF